RRRYRRWFHRYYGLSGSMPQYRDGLIRPSDAADAARWINAMRHGVRRTPLDSLIVLMFAPSHSPFVQALATTAEPRLQGRIAAVDLSGGYASYFAAFSGKTRSQIRRMERLLDATGV